MKHLRPYILLLVFFASTGSAIADSPIVGDWQTIDDVTGKTQSVVRITQAANGEYEGKVIEILHSDRGPNPLCENCPGERKGKPIKGMVILWGFIEGKQGKFKNGHVLDPKNGKIYKAKLRLRSDGKLELRGFVLIPLLGRTEVWEPST